MSRSRRRVKSDLTGIAALAVEAADNYAVFANDRVHPVDVKATDRDDLVGWLSGRLGRRVSVPDLAASGYRLMGGRLVATPHGPAGLLMYDDDYGTRVVVLFRHMREGFDAPMAENRGTNVAGYTWSDRDMGYSIVGFAAPSLLHPLADEVRRQIGGRA